MIRRSYFYFSLCLFFLVCFNQSQAQEQYKILNTVKDPSLSRGKSGLQLQMFISDTNRYKSKFELILNEDTVLLNTDSMGYCKYEIDPGNYKLRFVAQFCNDIVVSDSIQFKKEITTHLRIQFTTRPIQINGLQYNYDKPVIYLYPEKKAEISVQVKFDGELGFTYPDYKDGWKVIAEPDGRIYVNEHTYRYLFWEGQSKSLANDFFTKGFIVRSDTLVQFLESTLLNFGLNSQEIQDYITYWVPRMNKNDYNFIHFLIGEEYNKYASLQISPKPDTELRIFMIWSNYTSKESTIQPQTLPSLKRSGFSVIEWGGSEVEIIKGD